MSRSRATTASPAMRNAWPCTKASTLTPARCRRFAGSCSAKLLQRQLYRQRNERRNRHLSAEVRGFEALRLGRIAVAVGLDDSSAAIDHQDQRNPLADILGVTARLFIQVLRILRPDECVHIV